MPLRITDQLYDYNYEMCNSSWFKCVIWCWNFTMCIYNVRPLNINLFIICLFILKFYWSRVDLQCCDNFYCTVMIQLYIYTHPFFFRFFSHVDYHRILGRVPCAVQQVPIGQPFHIPQYAYANPKTSVHPSPPTPVPFGNHQFVYNVCESVSVLQISSFVSFFRFHI